MKDITKTFLIMGLLVTVGFGYNCLASDFKELLQLNLDLNQQKVQIMRVWDMKNAERDPTSRAYFVDELSQLDKEQDELKSRIAEKENALRLKDERRIANMELANFEAELSELTQLSHSAFLYDSRKEISQSYIDQRKREIEKHLEIIKQQLK